MLDRSWVRTALWAMAGFLALVVVLRLALPRPVPFGLLLFGCVIGSINALVAVGLILIYRANRIINFALAEIGIFAGILFENLVQATDVPWALALAAGTIAAAGLGGAVEYLVVRRFAHAPRLILTVVTIGLAQVVVVLTYFVAGLFDDQIGSTLATPLSGFTVVITGVRFSGDALALLASVPVLVAALNVFLTRTDFGVAVRASAESGERASLLGIPVRRVSTVMWVLAAAFTGVATMLRTPVVGVISGSTVQGPGLLLRALAAAVIARMENTKVAVFAAIYIGVVEQSLYFAYGGSSISDVVFVGIIIGALVLQRRSGQRADDADASSWAMVDEVRPVPAILRRLPEVRWGRVVVVVAVAFAAACYPLVASPSKENLAAAMAIYAIVAVSLVVLTGWAGQISLGQFGIVGFGAGVSARLLADGGVDFLLATAAGGVAGAAIALVLGAAALRIRGFYFAVTSLGFAVAMQTYFLDEAFFTALVPRNRPERPLLLGRFDLESEAAFYLFSIVVLTFVIVTARALRGSRTGRILIAVRDNEKAAQAYGVDHIRAKLTAFAISGVFAGVAGSLFAVHQHAVSNTAYAATESLRVFSMVVIGGLGSIPGAVLGAVFVRGASFMLSPQLAVLATGVGLLFVLLVFPGGLGRLIFDLRDRALRRIANRRGLVVPSLVADVRQPDPPPEPEASLELNDEQRPVEVAAL